MSKETTDAADKADTNDQGKNALVEMIQSGRVRENGF
jgi:hypothetical protein